MMKKLLLPLLICLIPFRLYAGAYVMPGDVLYNPYNDMDNYYITQQIIAWDENPDAKNPCYHSEVCYLGPDVRYKRDNPDDTGQPGLLGSCSSGNCIEISHLRTRKQVADKFKQHFGIPFTSRRFAIHADATVCVGLFYITHEPGEDEDAEVWPGSTCGQLPPVNQACRVSLPAEVNFGTLAAEELEGQNQTVTGYVQCRIPGFVWLTARSKSGEKDVMLSPDGSLYATLNLNRKRAGKRLKVAMRYRSAVVPFNLKVTLHKSGSVSPGHYHNAAIVMLSYN
ncbi:hypothetical protein BL250_15110 [Erwinia sp. OLTSP20]|uniref:MrpH family fimbial adhesin n=1 Tax=unclassified Erwinia TaxID=2622719 RepID=UPI000C19056A|nr:MULTISPECIES: hypothetical protein [unclassified Erwinia]PIJ48166.1 hypothetical protein BV501_18110 [Erwinia sp. OAMSP11]PIJ67065.1 hypothetical protein BK416_17150 [Erwinia sp. OLSSP12]PIJ78372.1 hypothetical protein BLD47_17280 [Erwinia sp. OLCASP19]PIJ79123.1 hypothetical protein BLD46_17340 [Erwinia sp. OLMTSP26]PIJ79980.1 hypothetical protein BLD49_17290 [Erwinia sp. OLMDSP33]